jgi:hypothetical protein
MDINAHTPPRILEAIIERGYQLQKDVARRPILMGAIEKIEAAHATGTGLELLPIEAAAIAEILTYHEACRALGLRRAAETEAATKRRKIIPFPTPTHHQTHHQKP